MFLTVGGDQKVWISLPLSKHNKLQWVDSHFLTGLHC